MYKLSYLFLSSGAPAEANHEQSPDTGSEQVASTPPPVAMERSESVFSSASTPYLSLSRLNSIFPVSRSSSESFSVTTPLPPIIKKSRVNSIHESITKMERVGNCVEILGLWVYKLLTIVQHKRIHVHDICIYCTCIASSPVSLMFSMLHEGDWGRG